MRWTWVCAAVMAATWVVMGLGPVADTAEAAWVAPPPRPHPVVLRPVPVRYAYAWPARPAVVYKPWYPTRPVWATYAPPRPIVPVAYRPVPIRPVYTYWPVRVGVTVRP